MKSQRTVAQRCRSLGKQLRDKRVGYVMIAPFTLAFATFTVIPVLVAIYYSFTYYNILQPPQWVGWDNYLKLFFNDEIFIVALKNTLVFAAVTGPVSYFLSLMVAWFVNELPPKIRSFMTLLFYAPAISGATAIWKIVFSGDSYGYLNAIATQLGLITSPKLWLTDPALMKISVITVVLWSSMGAGFLSFIAGFQNVDRALYEAAAVDGVKNRYQELWYITLPSMKGQLMFSAIMSITQSFGIGDMITQLCGFPSSDYAAHTIMHHLLDYGSIRYEMGYASAIACVLFMMMVGSNGLVQKVLAKIGT